MQMNLFVFVALYCQLLLFYVCCCLLVTNGLMLFVIYIQLLMTPASATSLVTIRSHITEFRKITRLELDISQMEKLVKILDELRRCVAHLTYIP